MCFREHRNFRSRGHVWSKKRPTLLPKGSQWRPKRSQNISKNNVEKNNAPFQHCFRGRFPLTILDKADNANQTSLLCLTGKVIFTWQFLKELTMFAIQALSALLSRSFSLDHSLWNWSRPLYYPYHPYEVMFIRQILIKLTMSTILASISLIDNGMFTIKFSIKLESPLDGPYQPHWLGHLKSLTSLLPLPSWLSAAPFILWGYIVSERTPMFIWFMCRVVYDLCFSVRLTFCLYDLCVL